MPRQGEASYVREVLPSRVGGTTEKKRKRQTWARKPNGKREGIYEEGKYGRDNSTENVKKGKKENMGDKTKLDGKREKRGRKIGARKKSRVREKREKNKGN